MKRQMMVLAGAAAILSGCMTEQMKSTPFYEGHDISYRGSAEDRVNLWPLAYWRNPVGSVAWPIFSFSDDHFAVRPLYSRYGDEHNFLWPIGQYNASSGDGRVFPFFWGEDYFDVFPILWNHGDSHAVFPLLFWEKDDYFTLFPIVWWDIDDNGLVVFPIFGHTGDADWLAPLYYHDDDITLVTPFFGRSKQGDNWLLPLYYHGSDLTWVTPLFGFNKEGDNWLFPFYACGGGDFYSLLWSSGSDGEDSWWCIPPLLSWGRSFNGCLPDHRYLLGLGGYTGGDETARSWLIPFWFHDWDTTLVTPIYGKTSYSQWLFPLYYRDRKLTLATPLYGEYEDARWLAPLFYKDNDGFYSIPFCREKMNGRTTITIPPLLSWYSSYKNHGSSTRLLLGLYGHDTSKRDGSVTSDWLFPLYSYNGSSGDVKTILFGRDSGSKSTDWWWLTPLVGNTTGERSGVWFQPLFNWGKDKSLPELERMMNAERLDASIIGEFRKETDYVDGKIVTNDVFRTKSECAGSRLGFCLNMLGTTRSIDMDGGDNESRWGQWMRRKVKNAAGKEWREGKDRTVAFTDELKFGNDLLFGGKSTRVVNFDYDTKEKVFDGELSESQALFGLVWSSRDEMIAGGHDYSKRALFWRLWHYEKLNGDSTLDVFPFITRDMRHDGYSQTSFLWRLFRYERDPKKGTSVDLLFIPVWRP